MSSQPTTRWVLSTLPEVYSADNPTDLCVRTIRTYPSEPSENMVPKLELRLIISKNRVMSCALGAEEASRNSSIWGRCCRSNVCGSEIFERPWMFG
jgi:hypothetical protein